MGRTPVLNACERKNEEVAKCLVQCGADVSIKDEKGKTALYYAAKNNLADVVKEIFVMRKSFRSFLVATTHLKCL
jgi:ankyrin repeat protein